MRFNQIVWAGAGQADTWPMAFAPGPRELIQPTCMSGRSACYKNSWSEAITEYCSYTYSKTTLGVI